MNDAELDRSSTAQSVAAEELERFRGIRQLRNHWTGGDGRRSYYWYLTFENCAELHRLVKHCREGLAFPYYDFTSPSGLHMTLDRIAFEDNVSPDRLRAVESAAVKACSDVPPFDINIGGLGGTPGAIGLSAFPREPIWGLRDALRAATLSVYPNGPIKESALHPHVAIGYCNSDVPAAPVIAAVERLNGLGAAAVSVKQVALVLLERQHRAYSWQPLATVPLAGTTRHQRL